MAESPDNPTLNSPPPPGVERRVQQAVATVRSGRFESLLAELERADRSSAELIERLRTAHLELELQAAELRESQTRSMYALQSFRTLLHLVPVPIWVIDERGIIDQWNVRSRACYPDVPEHVRLTNLLPMAEDRTRLLAYLTRRGSGPEGVLNCVHLRGNDDRPLVGDFTLQRIDGPLNQSRFMVAFIDHTHDIEREAALNQALRQAREASRAKSQFLSNVSHELRTPLHAIVGFGQLIASNLARGDPDCLDRCRQWASHLTGAANHLTDLVSSLLDVQSVETGSLTFLFESVGVQALLGEVVGLMMPRYTERGVALEVEALPDTTRVWADPRRLRQALINLLDNGAKYTPRGRRVRVESQVEGVGLRLSVVDQGPGLSPAQQAHLYEPFNRLGAATSGVDGMGLAWR